MDFISIILGLIAIALVLTIPGYFLTLAFFPRKEEIDSIERLTFSLVFSIAFLPLLVLIENQIFGIKIDFLSSLLTTIAIILFGLIVWIYRSRKLKKGEAVEMVFLKPFKKKF